MFNKYPIFYKGNKYEVVFTDYYSVKMIKIYLHRQIFKSSFLSLLAQSDLVAEFYKMPKGYWHSDEVGTFYEEDHNDDYYISLAKSAVVLTVEYYSKKGKEEHLEGIRREKLKEWDGVIHSPTAGGTV